MITIEDVAQRAGVSVATVSRVLNNNCLVAQEKVDKVNAAVEELGYKPSASKRKAVKIQSKMILVVMNVVIEEIIKGIKASARNNGYEVLLDLDAEKENADIIARYMADGRFEGIILANCFFDEKDIAEICENYPVVQCGNRMLLPSVSTISIDDEQAAYEITSHLIQTGKRRIAFTRLEENVEFSTRRQIGYCRALYENRIPIDSGLIFMCDHSYESGVEVANTILKMENRPDAVFCTYDMLAIGCMNTLKERHLSIPKDIAVTGFDDIELSGMAVPPITTVSQPFFEMGDESVRTLLAVINGEISNDRTIVIDHKLVIRESSQCRDI